MTIRRAVMLLALVAAIAIGGSYLPLDFLRPPVERALARGLGRPVEVGGIHLDLFGAPGLTLDDVVIHEDPRAGIEPFAYVPSLDAGVRWLSLFRRHLEFAYLNLHGAEGSLPTLNLVKTNAGPWNFQFLLGRTSADGRGADGARVPAIKMRDGRVNFKFGDLKSVFYFDAADLDVQPSSDGSVELRFGGAPSRTDGTARDFGRFFVNGTWRSAPAQRLDFNVDLERSSLAEVSRLIDTRGFGIHGVIALHAQLTGPLSGLDISGQLQVDDVHRWDLVPQGGGWKLPIKGTLDLRRETLELASASAGSEQAAPVSLTFRAWDFLTRTQWEAGAQLNRIPLAALAEVARHMGAVLPDRLSAEGGVSGTLNYTDGGGLTGRVDLEDASLSLPGAAPLRAGSAALDIAGGEVSLEPATVEIGSGTGQQETAELQGSYTLRQPHNLDLRLTTRGLSVGDTRSFGLAAIPLLDRTRQGTWRGWARYRAGEWSGEYEVLNARIPVDGLADPLRIQSASVKLNGARVAVTKLRATAGQIALAGDYHWDPAAIRPHKFNIVIEEADTAELSRLLAPSLVRERGFLARTLRLDSAPAPDWLKNRRADGTISIGTLTAGDLSLTVNPARLLWDAGIVRLIGAGGTVLSANLAGTEVAGDLEIDLGVDQKDAMPHYHFDGKIDDAPYKGGKLDFDGTFDAAGEGLQLIETAHAEGHLRARSIAFSSDAEFPTASACFELQGTHWKLGSVEVTQGGETYFGSGASQPDGKLVLDLMKGARQVRFSGPLFAAVR